MNVIEQMNPDWKDLYLGLVSPDPAIQRGDITHTAMTDIMEVANG